MKKFALVLLSAALLTGCNNSVSPSSSNSHPSAIESTSALANAADIMFAQMMIPHHSQAVDMSAYALANTTNPDVLALAKKISKAQNPEIDLMGGWLHQWGVHDMNDMNMGNDGMLTGTQLALLKKAKDSLFDKLFLTGMIAHHQGAIAMAQQEIDNGKNAEAIQLAKDIVSSQTAEIAQMKALLNK